MSRDLLPDLLQECLAAYDAGVAPEDCLAAYPTRRDELAPLFRQAICLRVSYAAAPREEFRNRARDAMMFAAGREVVQAYTAAPDREFVKDARAKFMHAAGAQAQAVLRAVPDPDPRYVARSRRRLIYAAGADAQESLRAVPPPRLPFWWNTRRTLLEAAAAKQLPQSRPVTMPARRPFGSFAFQAGLSMAVVVLAITAGTATYLTSNKAKPSAAAQVASLEHQVIDIEARSAAGQPVSNVEVYSLAKKTTELAERLSDQPATAGTSKLPSLIERQQAFVEKIYANTVAPAEVVQAQQQLDKAAAAVQPTPVGTSVAAAAAAATATVVPPTATIPAPPTAIPANTPIPAPLLNGQVRYGLQAGDTFAGLSWQDIRTAYTHFVAPSTWQLAGVTFDANGIARLVSNNYIGLIDQSTNTTVLFDVDGPTAGQILAVVNGQSLVLRTPDGRFINAEELVAKAGPLALPLRHIMDSFEISVPVVIPNTLIPPPPLPPVVSTPSPTPTKVTTAVPTSTKTASSPTPAATATPKPATPTATPTTVKP